MATKCSRDTHNIGVRVFSPLQKYMEPVDLTIKSIIKVKSVLKCNANLNKGRQL